MLEMFWLLQVVVDVEREEDEGGTIGDTFTDYVRFFSWPCIYFLWMWSLDNLDQHGMHKISYCFLYLNSVSILLCYYGNWQAHVCFLAPFEIVHRTTTSWPSCGDIIIVCSTTSRAYLWAQDCRGNGEIISII